MLERLSEKLLEGQYIMNKDELKKRSQQMTKEAQAAVAKRGIMQFRADPKDILALYDLALKRNQRVSTMIREWVLERFEQEHGNTPLKMDITVNKEKVGSVSIASAIFNTINKNAKAQQSNTKKPKETLKKIDTKYSDTFKRLANR